MVLDGGETGLLKHRDEAVGLWETKYGVWQILVGGTVVGYALAYPRQEFECIEFVTPQEEAVIGIGKFKHGKFASRLQHTAHLVKALLQIDEVAHAKAYCYAVEGSVGKGKMLGIALLQCQALFGS